MNFKKKVTYSKEGTSSTMLMYKQSSSIKSSFVGLTNGEMTDDCERASNSNDSIKSVFVGLADGELINDCDTCPTSNDEFDVLDFLRGRSTIIQSVGSMLISSNFNLRFLTSSFISESNKITANFVLKLVM